MNNSRIRSLAATLILAIGLPCAVAQHQKLNQASVELGPDGKLVYTPDERGNLIPDFSRCGYMGGGVKIPDVPVKLTLEPRPGMPKELAEYDPENPQAAGEGDDTQRIQEAIDEVSAMPLDKNGFRGAVLLKRGVYRTTATLRIKASGVVLRGEGQAKDGTVILCEPPQNKVAMVELYGQRIVKEVPGSRREIADTYVPWGVKSFNLTSVDGLAVGDKVVVFRPNTYEWLDVMGMRKHWGQKEHPASWGGGFSFYHMRFEREITAIAGNRITLDAPTVNAMEDQYGGGFVYKYTEQGAISQSGIERLRLIGAGPGPDNDIENGITFTGSVNCWARNITALHVRGSNVEVGTKAHNYADFDVMGDCKFVTVQDCAALKLRGRGGKSCYLYRRAQLCLTQRCMSESGRHCNSAGARVQGPNVYLDMVNVRGRDAGPHHNWAMGFLYDNVSAHTFVAYHGRPHAWRGAQIVFWNVWGHRAVIHQPPTAANYLFGIGHIKYGRKYVGTLVEPRSLYLKQLEERLGKEAVDNVTTEAQCKAVTDPESDFSRDIYLWDPIKYGIGEQINKAK